MRRLMYQSLIWAAVMGNDAGGLATATDAENMKRLSDPLVDGVGRNPKFGCDFFGGKVVGDQPKTFELALV